MKNSIIPRMLNASTNPASLQMLEPQKRATLLPVIRAKELALGKSVAQAVVVPVE